MCGEPWDRLAMRNPNAVINTLMKVYRWRSTRWWHSLQTEMMERDFEHHARWKHNWGWHNRGDVWDKIATEWAGKEDWMRARKMKSSPTGKYQFVTFVLHSVKLSTALRKERGARRLKRRHRGGWDQRTLPSTHVERADGTTMWRQWSESK